jgi:hypothetical protein
MDVKDFDVWVSKYPGSRARQLSELHAERQVADLRDVTCKAFIKWEQYKEAKQARGINSYSDFSKVVLGPIIEAFDKCLFKHHFFVKGTDPSTWPALLEETFGNDPVNATDFSSFEAHQYGVASTIVHYAIMHTLRDLPLSRYQRQMISRMVLGTNVCDFRDITVETEQRLMSGALWTSSSNGLMNLLFISYISNPHSQVADMVEWTNNEFRAKVEGDDGIFTGNIRTGRLHALGLDLKVEKHPNYQSAAFCQIMTDSAGNLYTDVPRALRKFWVLPMRFFGAKQSTLDAYFRCKALSYYKMYRNCPVLGELAYNLLLQTRSVDHRRFSDDAEFQWHRLSMEAAVVEGLYKTSAGAPCVTPDARLAVAELFGLPVDEQLSIEAKFRKGTWPIEHNFDYLLTYADYQHEANFLGGPRGGYVISTQSVHPELRPRVRKLRVDKEWKDNNHPVWAL